MNIRQQWKKIFFKKLVHYSTTLTLINASDTSLYGILAALSHRYLDISERPIANASRFLSSDEKKKKIYANWKGKYRNNKSRIGVILNPKSGYWPQYFFSTICFIKSSVNMLWT